MSRAIGWIGALAAALSSVSCASNDGTQEASNNPNRRCFFISSVNSFALVDSRTVNVRVGAGDFFRLDLMSSCRNATWSSNMSLVTRGSSSICTGSGIGTTLVVRGTGGNQRCSVRAVTQLTAEEVQALTPRQRP